MSARTPDSGPGASAAGTVVLDSGARAGAQGARHRSLGLALVVIATAQLMVVLDATIVNVALPHIQTRARASPAPAWSGSSTPTP